MDGLVASLVVIGYRFLVPFLILRYPLAGIFLAIAADASDAMIFEATGWGLFGGGANYSYWDKALDIWYLFFAWLAARKYWLEPLALKTANVLFWWRAAGVATFFLWPHRIVFVFAPSIFENFYILWTVVRKRRPGWGLTWKQLALIISIAAIPKIAQEMAMHWLFENQTWYFFRTYVFWWLYHY
ncbi:MAG: hypothetical protein UY75_C0014G0001 [Parcubacteria group bacterium GW2011_GWC2_52_8c]|nr:MAG: hypothetical protein UY75_C0014G0001 [Parcubacteria group bacterium GW2011_GWC2_52_8c]